MDYTEFNKLMLGQFIELERLTAVVLCQIKRYYSNTRFGHFCTAFKSYRVNALKRARQIHENYTREQSAKRVKCVTNSRLVRPVRYRLTAGIINCQRLNSALK